eukprot:1149882-Pelagomonas_calceolata.AAC.1
MGTDWQGPRKRVLNLSASVFVFQHGLVSKEPLQPRCKLVGAGAMASYRQQAWPYGMPIWNTAGRAHLNNQNSTWLQGLAKDIPEAKWFVKNVRNDPIRNARHAVMLGIG